MIGTIAKVLEREAAGRSKPTVEIVVGQGRPNVGIVRILSA
jgi:hypothetical protein